MITHDKTRITSKTARKQYTPEFRDEALKLAERIGVAAASRYESQLCNWRRRHCQINPRQQFRHMCDEAVRNAFAEAKQRYGAPRLAGELPEYISAGKEYR